MLDNLGGFWMSFFFFPFSCTPTCTFLFILVFGRGWGLEGGRCCHCYLISGLVEEVADHHSFFLQALRYLQIIRANALVAPFFPLNTLEELIYFFRGPLVKIGCDALVDAGSNSTIGDREPVKRCFVGYTILFFS